MINVLLIEHAPLTRVGISTVLGGEADIEVIAETGDASEGFEFFRRHHPNVVILGLKFPNSCSIDDLDNYFTEDPKAKIIVLAEHEGDAEITRALKKGALGYICKDVAPAELVAAIRTVATGKRYIPADIAVILSEHIGREELTATETNILRMIVGGMANKEIAFALDISENTGKTHIQNIFGKIGVSDRTSAATAAIRRGLVRVDL